MAKQAIKPEAEERSITLDQERFYKALYSNLKGYIEIRLIGDQGVRQIFLTYKELLHYTPPMDVNVYAGIFGRRIKKGTTDSCNKTNALYLDFDDMAREEIEYRIDMAGVPYPSLIVHSGHGYHCYWLLQETAGKEIQPLLKALQEKLAADAKATDVARILRVPDTMNVKGEPIQSRLVHYSEKTHELRAFESILGVNVAEASKEPTGAILELLRHTENGLHNMAYGVDKGERNFCTGRIVQTLRRLNYTKQETTDIVFRWNLLNRPKKATAELQKDIHTFWYDARYKYDGKMFSESHLQSLNERFIDRRTKFFNGMEAGAHNYDNELLSPKVFQKVSGLTFAILSIVKLAESDGIRREHIADLCKRHPMDKNLQESLKLLQSLKHIKVTKRGRTNYYVFTEKANYKRGYTAVGKSLHRSFIHGEIKEHEYKLMILLESYAFDGKDELYPSARTLALTAGQSEQTIRNNLKRLEHKQFIKMFTKEKKRFIRLIYR